MTRKHAIARDEFPSADDARNLQPNMGWKFRFRGDAASTRRLILLSYPGGDTVKQVAIDAGVPVDTARNWCKGRYAPRLEDFQRWMSNRPDIASAIGYLQRLEAELDPEFERALAEFVRLWQRQR